MANFNDIKHEIDQNVNTNGVQAITGAILNETLKDMIDEVDEKKQDTLVAGSGILINGNVISATGGGGGQEYYEGRAIDIDSSNRINVVPSELPFYLAGRGLNSTGGTLAVDYDSIPSEIAGNGLQDDGNGNLAVNPSDFTGHGLEVDGDGRIAINPGVVQEKLQAGANIQISGNTISATDTTYGAGQGLQQTGNVFSVKAGSGLGFDANGNLINTGGGGGGATYSAGQGIDIDSNNVISAKTGPGLLVDPTTNNIKLDRSALNFLPLEGGVLQDTTPANDTTLTVIDGMNEDYVKIVAPENAGEAPHVEIFENGSGDTKFYYDHLERGTQTTINYPSQSGTLALTSDIPYAPVYSGGNAIDIDASTNAISVNYSGGGLYLDGNNQLAVDYNSIPGPIAGNGLQDDMNGHLQVDTSVVQEKLVAGQNITISGNVISASGGSGGNYLPLDGGALQDTTGSTQTRLQLLSPNGSPAGSVMEISSNYGYGNISIGTAQTDQTVLQNDLVQVRNATSGKELRITSEGLSNDAIHHASLPTLTQNEILATQSDVNTAVSGKQDILTAGSGISIQGNVISATGGSGSSYSAGNGIDITNNTISVDATDLDGTGLTTNQNGELEVDTNVIQGKLTAGSGISIQNNVISATGGSGSSLWTSGTGTDSLFAPGTGSDIEYVDPSDPSQGINNQSVSSGNRSIATGSFTKATGDYSAAFGENANASGYASAAFGVGSSAFGYGSFASGSWTNADGPYSAAFGESTTAYNTTDFVAGYQLYTSGMQGHEAAFGTYNNIDNANGPYLFTIGDGELQEINHVYGTPSWEPNPDDPESTDNWTENVEVRKNAVDIKTNGDVFIENVGGYDGTNSSNAASLQTVISGKQDTLTAGTGISIQGNVISATGGGGSGLWTSGTGTGSVMSPGAFQANGNNSVSAGDYTRSNGTSSIALGTSTTTTGLSAVAIGANSTAAGSYSVALGHGLGAVNSDETALGKFNNYIDTGTTAEKTFFTVGNGTSNNTKSNIIEIKQNNDAYLVGIGGFDGTNASQALSLQTVINSKQNQLVSGVDVKTINGQSIVGGGNLVISGGSYSAGDGIGIQNDTISVKYDSTRGIGYDNSVGHNELYVQLGNGLRFDGNGAIELSGGSGSSYTAGAGINIDANNAISSTTFVPGTGTGSILSLNANRATGADSFALGDGAKATGNNAVAIGYSASALKNDSISLGGYVDAAYSFGGPATVINTNANYSAALGYNSQVDAEAGVAIGYNSKTVKPYEYTIGKFNKTYSSNSDDTRLLFSIGNGTSSLARSNVLEIKNNNDAYLIGIGGFDGTNAANALTLQTVINSKQNQLVSGVDVKTINGQSIVGGGNLVISGGSGLWTSGTGQNSLVSPGAGASSQGSDASGIGSIVIGEDSNANGDYSFVHGQGSMANGDYSAAFVASNSTGDYSFAAGTGADAQALSSVAIGSSATTVFDNSNPSAPINAEGSVAICGTTYALNAVSIGAGSAARGERSIAISGGEASGLGSFAEGYASHANGLYSTAFAGSTAEANYSFAGSAGQAYAHYSTALSGGEARGEGAFAAGQGNQAYGYGAAALGYMAQTYSQANGALSTDPNAGEVALGRYNYSEQGIVFTVGCGYYDETDPDNPQEVRQNAVAIDSTGKIFLKGLGGYTGTSTSGCTDLVTFLSNLQ